MRHHRRRQAADCECCPASIRVHRRRRREVAIFASGGMYAAALSRAGVPSAG